MSRNISEADYSLITVKDFFGGTDKTRIVILVYIFLSFLFNIINFSFTGIKIYKKKGISMGIIVTCSLLFVNFTHTFAYLFEWVIKKGIDIVEITDVQGKKAVVGGLLTGNPSHFFSCYAQTFILISSSISQDFIINIFFYMVSSNEAKQHSTLTKLLLLIFGFIFPIGFTFIYYFIGALGLNDEFCYVTKFYFKINDDNHVKYFIFEKFQFWVIIVYAIRVLNFFITFFFLIKIIIFVKKENLDKIYIFKSIIIPIIQLFTIFIGVIYRLLNFSSSETSAKISWLYLILNTSDGVLFPLIFLFQNNIFTNIKNYINDNIKTISSDDDDNNNRLIGDNDDDD